jgi:tetratricopeptide (TPR) repeat protein
VRPRSTLTFPMGNSAVPQPRHLVALTLLAICALPLRGQRPAPTRTVTSIQESIEAGKYPEAVRKVAAALALYPNDAGLLNLRGVIHAQKNELAEARKDFERAVTLDPQLTPAWQNLARSCQFGKEGAPADSRCAANAWQRVLDALPGDPEARFSLAALYEEQGKYADSLREIEKLPVDEMARSPTLALKCADLAGLNRLHDAGEVAKLWTSASEFSEADVKSILPSLATPDRAPLVVTLVEALDARGAASLDTLRSLVLAYEQVNRLSDARKTLERLALADPANPQHLFELARVAYLAHDLEGALGYLGHARDLVPSDPRVHFLFGMVLQELQLPLDARKSVEKAVALDPHNPDYNYALGSIILTTREASAAVACFRNYVEAKPSDPRGHFALGIAYFAAGDYDNCRAEMLPLSKDPRTEAGAAYFLGRVARIEENLDEAATFLDRSIRLLPSFAEAYTELARVRIRQDRLEDAKAAIDRALSLDPESFLANSTLLAIYQRTHDSHTEEQTARLKKLDEARGKRQELMLRSIEVKPY